MLRHSNAKYTYKFTDNKDWTEQFSSSNDSKSQTIFLRCHRWLLSNWESHLNIYAYKQTRAHIQTHTFVYGNYYSVRGSFGIINSICVEVQRFFRPFLSIASTSTIVKMSLTFWIKCEIVLMLVWISHFKHKIHIHHISFDWCFNFGSVRIFQESFQSFRVFVYFFFIKSQHHTERTPFLLCHNFLYVCGLSHVTGHQSYKGNKIK